VFGQVIIVDSTNSTNYLGRPLLEIIAVDGEMKNVLLGAAFMHDETADSLCFVFKSFKELAWISPWVIITNEDPSFFGVLADLYTITHHRLCAWHLCQNFKKKQVLRLRSNTATAIQKEIYRIA
jgi:MULE transposase domain